MMKTFVPQPFRQNPRFTRSTLWLVIISALHFVAAVRGIAQTDFLRLKSFGNSSKSAATPSSSLFEGNDSRFYGTTSEGGSNDLGTVFRVKRDGSDFSIVHHFAGGTNDGQSPRSGVIEGPDGGLYGSTFSGGLNNLGTIFRVSWDGSSYSILHHFTAVDGTAPQGPLLSGADGALYGTTDSTLFKLNADGSGFQILHLFTGGADGRNPQSGVVKGSDGFLYGTTYSGGASNLGTMFRINEDGSAYAVLFSFGANSGRNPQAPPIEGSDGFLYGTTSSRQTNSYGSVYKLTKDGTTYTKLHEFSGAGLDGWYPQPALAEGADGALYGVTSGGGDEGQGTIFKIDKAGGGYSILHSFSWSADDGRVPLASLLKSSDGWLYGTSTRGGSSDYGVIFQIDQTGAQYKQVHSFNWAGEDGWNPQARLIEGSDGRLYGTAANGGSNDFGVVFAVNKDRTGYTVLHHFVWQSDGAFPQGGVVEATNGALYGTTFEGGSNRFGTIFRMNKDGSALTILHHFSGLNGDGTHPQAKLLQASNGMIYGTTSQGGSNNWGTVFRFHQDGSGYEVLRDIPGTNVAEIEPVAGLVEASDGLLYGTTSGGQGGTGSAFSIANDGSGFTNLHLFTGPASEGRGIVSELLQASDGTLYGAAFTGGVANVGTLFKLNTDGSGFSIVKSFSLSGSPRNPAAALIQSSNGGLYGTSVNGSATNSPAATNWGTVFRIDGSGSNYSIIHDFRFRSAGRNPTSPLTLASDGTLYGSTSTGGDMGAGALFNLADPPFFTEVLLTNFGTILRFQGSSSRAYAIEATTNLMAPDWQSLVGTESQTNGSFEFLDSTGTNFPARFYRAVTQ